MSMRALPCPREVTAMDDEDRKQVAEAMEEIMRTIDDAEELCGFYAGYVYGIAHAVWLTVGGGEG